MIMIYNINNIILYHMSFSYNDLINISKNNDREKNKDFNRLILNSGKKKSNQNDIDTMMNKTSEKIYDVITLNEKKYFIDKQVCHILDEDTNVVGIIDKNKYIWFSECDDLMEKLKKEDKEVDEIYKEITYK